MNAEPRWDDRYWTSRDGLRLHYRDYAGPADRLPVLCLHGVTRNARDFEDLAPRLALHRRVIVPDFRGRGLSEFDPQPARYSPPFYAADILQLIDELSLERAIFIGTSLGGLVTMAIASAAPHLIAGTVLNDIGPVIDPAGLARIRGYIGQPAVFSSWAEAASAAAAAHGGAHPNYTAADWERMARRLCREEQGRIIFDYDMAVGIAARAAYDAPPVDGWPYFRKLESAPLLVLRGELSDLLSADVASAMARAHPDAELVTVAGVGHAPDLSEPDAAAAIERLLRRVDD